MAKRNYFWYCRSCGCQNHERDVQCQNSMCQNPCDGNCSTHTQGTFVWRCDQCHKVWPIEDSAINLWLFGMVVTYKAADMEHAKLHLAIHSNQDRNFVDSAMRCIRFLQGVKATLNFQVGNENPGWIQMMMPDRWV